MLAFIYFPISLVDDISQFIANECLLWRNVLPVPCPRVEEADIVFKFRSDVGIAECLLCLPRAMIQIGKAHFRNLVIHEKDVLRVQVCMDYVFLMQDFQKIDDLDGDFDCLILCEECLLRPRSKPLRQRSRWRFLSRS